MAERIKFTDRTIAALPPPAAGQRAEYADTETDGLRLRVTSSGVKTFSLLRRIRNGPMERLTLGRFPDAYKTEAARTKAAEAKRDHRRRRESGRSEAGAQGRADLCRTVRGIHRTPREAAQAHLARRSTEVPRLSGTAARTQEGFPHRPRRSGGDPFGDYASRASYRGEPGQGFGFVCLRPRNCLGLSRQQSGEGHRRQHREKPRAVPKAGRAAAPVRRTRRRAEHRVPRLLPVGAADRRTPQ